MAKEMQHTRSTTRIRYITVTLLPYLLLVGGHYIQLRVWLHSILEGADTHSHVLKYTEVWRILLLMAWLLASTLLHLHTH
jgi:hypothetical protein